MAVHFAVGKLAGTTEFGRLAKVKIETRVFSALVALLVLIVDAPLLALRSGSDREWLLQSL